MHHNHYINKCIRMAAKNVEQGEMPFAAMIVKDGETISHGINDGLSENDPTAHGEMRAIQQAGRVLKTTDLSDCILYTNCEPCPMCYAAAYWAGIKHVYYGLSIDEQADYDNKPIELYADIAKPRAERAVAVEAGEADEDPRGPFDLLAAKQE
ncbi:nucleoside deaminase [Alkalicoccus chagannorensis]|uniref:nucleoside deaminase n=1 Tax=Alkalicoccus chagannorensis TaxID=427072 RepID=UPI00041A695B|nr:nucleoside deaminase [Alkalicoccus chagannorensis]